MLFERKFCYPAPVAQLRGRTGLFPAYEWRDRLDSLISAAQKAGVGSREICQHP
jgi:hypothetical protein